LTALRNGVLEILNLLFTLSKDNMIDVVSQTSISLTFQELSNFFWAVIENIIGSVFTEVENENVFFVGKLIIKSDVNTSILLNHGVNRLDIRRLYHNRLVNITGSSLTKDHSMILIVFIDQFVISRLQDFLELLKISSFLEFIELIVFEERPSVTKSLEFRSLVIVEIIGNISRVVH